MQANGRLEPSPASERAPYSTMISPLVDEGSVPSSVYIRFEPGSLFFISTACSPMYTPLSSVINGASSGGFQSNTLRPSSRWQPHQHSDTPRLPSRLQICRTGLRTSSRFVLLGSIRRACSKSRARHRRSRYADALGHGTFLRWAGCVAIRGWLQFDKRNSGHDSWHRGRGWVDFGNYRR